MTDKKIRVGILGASGYVGADLVRLLVNHPYVEIVLLTAERKAGHTMAQIFPHFVSYTDLPPLMKIEEIEWPAVEVDVIFTALPHATSQSVIKGLFHATNHTILDEIIAEGRADLIASHGNQIKVIDLSADFRLRDTETYAQWYGDSHSATDLQEKAVYGLTEYYRDDIQNADLVACPGCYPTVSLLPLKGLLEEGLISGDDIIIDAKSGVSGAGRSTKESLLFTELSDAMAPYGVGHHRHMPEIEQELDASRQSATPTTISFTPHLVPMNRGMMATSYVRLSDGVSAADLRASLIDRAANDFFITVLDEGVMPATRMVRGSNHCVVNVFADRAKGRAIVISAIDNLVKGSSGQAIQNMNVMMGWAETTGLEQVALFP